MESLEMMNLMSVSKVEEFFDSVLRGRLTDNLFFDQMPVALGKDWKSFAIVDCGTALRDYDAYGAGMVRIYLYTVPLASGVKDVKEMYRLEGIVNEVVAECSDGHYVLTRAGSYSGYDGVNDMFYNIIQLNLIIR